MNPSSRYSGLCITTSTGYTANNEIYTQNTYTIKSERINPTVYRPIQANPGYTTYRQPQTTAIQAYQQALQQYQNPHQTFDQAQQSYQLALQAYNRAYAPAPSTYGYQTSPAVAHYDWSAYFG